VWFASDLKKKRIRPIKWIGLLKKKRIRPIKWIGLSGVFIITVGIIWSITSASFTSYFIEYLGLYIWVGFFFSELLQRNEVPGLEDVDEAKIFEALMKDSKRLVEQGNKQYNKKGYEDSIDNWESAIKMYEKSLEFSPSSDQKEKIKSNLGMLQDNIINALEVSANKYNKRAIKAHDNQDLEKAEQEWNHSVSNFTKLLKIIKSEKLNLETSKTKTKIESIRKNLEQLEIEKLCAVADKKLGDAQTLKDKEITIALEMATEAISSYSEALEKARKNPEFTSLVENIKTKMFNVRNFQEGLEEKMDELIGITPLTTEIIIEHDDDSDYKKVQSTIKADKGKKSLKIIREYEFIGGQVRFKVGLINNTNNPLTNFKISFDLPDALKWVLYEPDKYERKGDSILIAKLGKNEKKTVSLYLEPINCMESPVNATISFFDVNDRPQAIPMKPKMISISCPIFFTKEEANIARVKKLQRSLTLRDKKIFPIVNDDALSLFFSTTLSVLGNYDIKLISREFSEEERFGEAWFYGITKVKKNRIITYIILDGENKTLEIEVSADDHGQITGFLAEIGNKIREELLKLNIIGNEEQFYDMSMSIHLNHCPYCWNIIPSEQIQGYLKGDPIDCKYCGETLTIKK
jgi:tetratricopeptide (TPR) repeat protein